MDTLQELTEEMQRKWPCVAVGSYTAQAAQILARDFPRCRVRDVPGHDATIENGGFRFVIQVALDDDNKPYFRFREFKTRYVVPLDAVLIKLRALL